MRHADSPPSYFNELRSAAAKDPRVSFLGFLQDEDVPDFFASLDVFAFPSVNPLEAFGIAQLEAMSAGLPVVASDLPGVRIPVLRTGNGILVPPGDVPALAMALVDPGLKKAPRGDRHVGDPRAPSAEYERLIRQIIG